MIDIKKKYQTRDGLEARIYATDGTGHYCVHGSYRIGEEWEITAWDHSGNPSNLNQNKVLIPLVRKDALGQELPEDMSDLPEGEWVWVKEAEGLRTIERGHKFESDWMGSMKSCNAWGGLLYSCVLCCGGADYYIQKLHRPDGTRIDEPQGKTPEQWFQKLPEGIRERAIANIDKDYPCYEEYPPNLNEAVCYSFDWVGTKEGADFWTAVDAAAEERSSYPALPEKRYWSKPSDFPPVCWVILSPHETNCFPVTAIIMELQCFSVHGHRLPFSNISQVRWNDRPFDRYEDGKECVVES